MKADGKMGTAHRQQLKTYHEAAVAAGMARSAQRLSMATQFVFRGVELAGKRMLDIGGGSGLFSFYAACTGAEEVVCLEPEAAGSTPGVIAGFRRFQEHLSLADRVKLEPLTFQSYATTEKKFDVILLYNSINHLDEPACINLLKDEGAKRAYLDIFSRLYHLSSPGATLILCDCSRHNFFAHLGICNPFCPMIEWHKHQSPRVWARLLAEVGFCRPRIAWNSFSRLGRPGRWFLGNTTAAYFLSSHFRLQVQRPVAGTQ